MPAALLVPAHPALHLKTSNDMATPMPSPLVSPMSPQRKGIMGGLISALDTPPSPSSPTLSTGSTNTKGKKQHSQQLPFGSAKITIKAPVVDYAMLRQHHATTLRYVIAKLRWEQANNGYTRGEKPWMIHNRVIADMEAELKMVEAAQKGLDQFADFAYAPFADPKPHGPQSQAQLQALQDKERKRVEERDKILEREFPWLKQLFIGPKTKQEARNDKAVRERIENNNFDDLEHLLPKENWEMAIGGGGEKKKRKSYWDIRMEREKKAIRRYAEEKEDEAEDAQEEAKSVRPAKEKEAAAPVGPVTKEEYVASLPHYGPQTRQEAMLPVQREQRHYILNLLKRPWPVYDEDMAGVMEEMGKLALDKLAKMDVLKERARAEGK